MIVMARSRKKYTAYRKVCAIIGQPAAEFADHLRKLVGEEADSTAQVVTYNPNTRESYVVTVAAHAETGWGGAGGGGGGAGNEEFLLTLAENREYVPDGGTGTGGTGGGGGAAKTGAAKPTGAKGRRTLFKGRVQLPPTSAGRQPAASSRGTAGNNKSDRQGQKQKRRAAGLSSIAGVCMLCAVASAGGLAFYGSYMSQTADHGTIEVIRAEVLDVEETHGGRFIDLELFASHTSCVQMYDRNILTVLHEEGDGCRDTWRDPPPEATSYDTSTGVHVVVDDLRTGADDREWLMLEIQTDAASIVHPVRVVGSR